MDFRERRTRRRERCGTPSPLRPEGKSRVKGEMGCSGNVEHCRNLAHLENKVAEA